jgi:hypothetical protein
MAQKAWKTVGGFAFLGLAMAALSYANAAFHDYAKPMNSFDFALLTASVILCPPQLLFAFCIDCEVIGWSGFFIYSIIGVLNLLLYAAIAAGVTGVLTNQIEQSSSKS